MMDFLFFSLSLSFVDTLVHGGLLVVLCGIPVLPTDSRLGPADPLRPGARLGIVRMPNVDPSAQQPLRRAGRRRWVDSSHFPYILFLLFLWAITLSNVSLSCAFVLWCGWDYWQKEKMKDPEKKRRTTGGNNAKRDISKTKWMAQSFPDGKTPLRHITIP